MVERGQKLRLAPEARHAVRVAREGLGQHLDRHLAAEPRVLRAINLAHPALPERSEDFVWPESGARNCCHGKPRVHYLPIARFVSSTRAASAFFMAVSA